MQNPEVLQSQNAPESPVEECTHGVMLDPDSIRALLAKIKETIPQE